VRKVNWLKDTGSRKFRLEIRELQVKLNEMSSSWLLIHATASQDIWHFSGLMRQEAPSSLWILASLNPWDPWLPLFLYCLLAAHLRTTCVNALCGVNCLLPHLPTPKPIPAAPHLRISASSLIWVTNAALVSPLVTAPSPLPPTPTPVVPPSPLQPFTIPLPSIEPFKPPPCVDKLCA